MQVPLLTVQIEVVLLSDLNGLEGIGRDLLIPILWYSPFVERSWAIRGIYWKTLERDKSFEGIPELIDSIGVLNEEILCYDFGLIVFKVAEIFYQWFMIQKKAFLQRWQNWWRMWEFKQYFFCLLNRHFEFGCIGHIDLILIPYMHSQRILMVIENFIDHLMQFLS